MENTYFVTEFPLRIPRGMESFIAKLNGVKLVSNGGFYNSEARKGDVILVNPPEVILEYSRNIHPILALTNEGRDLSPEQIRGNSRSARFMRAFLEETGAVNDAMDEYRKILENERRNPYGPENN